MRGNRGSVRLFVSLGLALAFVLGFSLVGSAQVQNGTFTGTVTDPSGAVIPGATVTVTNVGTSLTATVDTDSGGLYRAAEMPVGSYKIEVSASGFKTAVKTGLFLSAGTIQRVDFQLEVGAKTEVVTVEAVVSLVQTDDSRLYETVGAGRVANLPLNGRNVYALIQLAPGAVNVAGVSFENGQGTVDGNPDLVIMVGFHFVRSMAQRQRLAKLRRGRKGVERTHRPNKSILIPVQSLHFHGFFP